MEFEVFIKNFLANTDSFTEDDIDELDQASQKFTESLSDEISELECIAMSSVCEFVRQSIHNYIIFLDWCIEEINRQVNQIKRDVELILINEAYL